MFRQQVIIQASFIKDGEALLIIFNFIFQDSKLFFLC